MDDLIKRDDALKACMLREDNPPTEMQLSLRNVISALPAIDPAAIREAALREAAAMCDIAPCNEWNDECKDGYGFAADECKRTILALIGEKK